jgi:hypothetical protein
MFGFVFGPAATAALFADALREGASAVSNLTSPSRAAAAAAAGRAEAQKTYVVEMPQSVYEKSIVASIELARAARVGEDSGGSARGEGGAVDREGPMGPLIFLSLLDDPGSRIPFGVFLDTTTKSVVVAMRGTQSLEDTMSDLLAVGDDENGNVGEFDLARCASRVDCVSGVRRAFATVAATPPLYFVYRYILRESCSQFDSLPLTSLTIPLLQRSLNPLVHLHPPPSLSSSLPPSLFLSMSLSLPPTARGSSLVSTAAASAPTTASPRSRSTP